MTACMPSPHQPTGMVHDVGTSGHYDLLEAARFLISQYRQGYCAFVGDKMPTRHDFERLIEWCDKTESFEWLKAIAGAALAVHPVLPIGSTGSPRALALLTGNIALREAPGISELPAEPVRFDGTLVGVRNPGRQAQLTIRADGDRIVSKLSGLGIPSTWSSGFDIEHVQDEAADDDGRQPAVCQIA